MTGRQGNRRDEETVLLFVLIDCNLIIPVHWLTVTRGTALALFDTTRVFSANRRSLPSVHHVRLELLESLAWEIASFGLATNSSEEADVLSPTPTNRKIRRPYPESPPCISALGPVAPA